MTKFVIDITLSLSTEELFVLKKAAIIKNSSIEDCVRTGMMSYCNDIIKLSEKPTPVLEVLEEEEVVVDKSTDEIIEIQQ